MTFHEITSACQVLFGPEATISPGFIAYLQPAGLKSAYRQQALQTHPDRAASIGEDQGAMTSRFRLVQSAYETLKPYVMDRKPLPPLPQAFRSEPFIHPASRPTAAPRPAAAARPTVRPPAAPPASAAAKTDFFFQGSLPRTRLRLGQFLYYRRKISWWTLVRAMVWQQTNRPRLGDLAQEQGWLELRDEEVIRGTRSGQELWGEAAVRCGLLTEPQLRQLLEQQRRWQMPIGRYFVDHQHLSEPELFRLLVEQRRHNYMMAQRT
jgi:hypothetical protein